MPKAAICHYSLSLVAQNSHFVAFLTDKGTDQSLHLQRLTIVCIIRYGLESVTAKFERAGPVVGLLCCAYVFTVCLPMCSNVSSIWRHWLVFDCDTVKPV